MERIKWIKLDINIFNNRKIRQIEALPDGSTILVIWLKLLVLAGNVNDGGLVYFTRDIAYTEEMLATEFNVSVQTLKMALSVFANFEMIEVVDNVYRISNWEKYQNVNSLEKIKEDTRVRVANYRERQKQIATKEAEQEKPKADPKHKYGRYQHVILSESENEKLKQQYADDYDTALQILDDYLDIHKANYKSHYIVMNRGWVVKALEERKEKQSYTKKQNNYDGNEMTVEDVDVNSLREALFNAS